MGNYTNMWNETPEEQEKRREWLRGVYDRSAMKNEQQNTLGTNNLNAIGQQNNSFGQSQDNQWTNSSEKSVQSLYNDCAGDSRYQSFMQRLKSPGHEGRGYIDDPKLIDQPTNTGIRQSTLRDVFSQNPVMQQAYQPDEGATVNDTLRNLNEDQIDNIYCQNYYKPYRIKDINSDRIAYSAFDAHVMSGPSGVANTFQKSLNETGYPVKKDGVFGSETINALNNLSQDNKEDEFMNQHLIPNRINYLGGLRSNGKYGGWFPRTRKY